MTPPTKCACGCCHVPDHGACDKFEAGAGGTHCVYCDHGPGCHPGKGKYFNGPLRPGVREVPATASTEPPTPRISAGMLPLLAMAGTLAPFEDRRTELAGHQCPTCRLSLGHAEGCKDNARQRFAQHAEHCRTCRKGINKTVPGDEGLCPRGKRLWERATR